MGTRVTGRRIIPVEPPRELMVRGLSSRAISNQLQSIVLSDLPSQGRVRPRIQEGRTQGRVYHITHENVGVVPDMVAGTLQLDTMQVYTLIDPGASHSFVAYKIMNNMHVLSSKLGVGVTVSTPLGENIQIDDIYRGVKLYVAGLELRVDLMPLELYDFDLILGMD